MTTIDLIRSYLLNPYSFWAPNDRRALKVEKRLVFASRTLRQSPAATIDYLEGLALRRLKDAQGSFYLCNAGSSGSHWVQGILSAIVPVLPCGEVYLPPKVLAKLKNDKTEERKVALQLIYLVHSFLSKVDTVDVGGLVTSLACNTAHAPGNLHIYRAADISNRAALLIRDPADIAISRTFRKESHRAYLGKTNDDDMDFLSFNCDFVNNFYSGVVEEDFDIIIRYEDLVKKASKPMQEICRTLGLNAEAANVGRAIEIFDQNKLTGDSQEAKMSNIYAGERKKIEKRYIEFAKKATAHARARFGY